VWGATSLWIFNSVSHVFARQTIRVTQVGERIWLATFMQHDLGYFGDENVSAGTGREPIRTEVLPIRSEWNYVSFGIDR